jgi:MoaA/NifB/PqqE/SkfB family radical SAM enzyme
MIEKKIIPGLIKTFTKSMFGYTSPMKVTHYITLRCNLNCGYCGRKNLRVPELTTEEIRNYIREFRRLGTYFWSFNGGECLLREDLGELLRFATDMGMKCNIVTNGILVPKRIDWLKNLDLVITSIDGPEPVQDKIRGKGVFEKNIKALEVLAEKSIPTVVVSVITNENVECLKSILDVVEYYGHSWDVQPVVVHRGDEKGVAGHYRFDRERFLQAIDWIIAQKKEGKPVFSAVRYLEDMKRFPHCLANENCWAGKLFCVVAPDGALHPCAEFVGTNAFRIEVTRGNIGKAFRSIPDMSRCKNCFFSCYSEYNLILNNKVRESFRIARNILQGKWFWW